MEERYFFISIAMDDEELPEGKEKHKVALLGSTNVSEFIERIAESAIETIDHMGKGKVPAGVLYYKLMDEIAKHITEKAGDPDMEMIRMLMGD